MPYNNLVIFTVGILISWIVLFIIVVILAMEVSDLKEMAVKQECAHYNSVDGQFEWIRNDIY